MDNLNCHGSIESFHDFWLLVKYRKKSFFTKITVWPCDIALLNIRNIKNWLKSYRYRGDTKSSSSISKSKCKIIHPYLWNVLRALVLHERLQKLTSLQVGQGMGDFVYRRHVMQMHSTWSSIMQETIGDSVNRISPWKTMSHVPLRWTVIGQLFGEWGILGTN